MVTVTTTPQDAILRAAATTLARDPGASMQEIAAEAGVGRATVHRYFPKREDLIREIALSCNAKIDEVIEPIRGQGLTASVMRPAMSTNLFPLFRDVPPWYYARPWQRPSPSTSRSFTMRSLRRKNGAGSPGRPWKRKWASAQQRSRT